MLGCPKSLKRVRKYFGQAEGVTLVTILELLLWDS